LIKDLLMILTNKHTVKRTTVKGKDIEKIVRGNNQQITNRVPSMSSIERQTQIQKLREELCPDNFDAWVCLGGDFRDMAEVQEWATDEEKARLLSQYSDFQIWMRDNQ